ncbi:MAG: ATP-grasp domain-containing protein [Bacillota bacterium]|nr:ATP-grasp domain-containing protein [Bacillota bacterium]
MAEMNIYARILIDEARRRGIEVEEIDSRFNIYTLAFKGRTVRCRESLTEKTSAYAMTISANKWLSLKFLRQEGLSVPRQEIWESEGAAVNFLRRVGRLAVKPLNGEQGKGITVGVSNPEDLAAAVEKASRLDDQILLEEYIESKDLRIIVIDYRFVAAIERVPAAVTGDGISTVEELITTRNKQLQRETDGESLIPLEDDTAVLVGEQGLSLNAVPAEERMVRVCRLANFHSGGTIEDVTSAISPELRAVAEKASRILELPVVGLDLMVPAVGGDEYAIIEANERPGLANHEPQPTAERFIDFLFPETAEH